MAVGVVGGLQGRAQTLHLAVRLLVGQVAHQHRQPARGGEALHGTVGQAGVVQLAHQFLGEGGAQIRQSLGGQLFGTQFNQ